MKDKAHNKQLQFTKESIFFRDSLASWDDHSIPIVHLDASKVNKNCDIVSQETELQQDASKQSKTVSLSTVKFEILLNFFIFSHSLWWSQNADAQA